MRAARILGTIAAVIVIAMIGIYSVVWLGGERVLALKYETPVYTVSHSTDAAAIARGARIADITGCTSCHGADLNGKIMGEEKFVYRSVAPNLTRLAATYSDADLARVIRHGVRANGTSVWGMPARAFFDLSDEDIEAVISFIRSRPDKSEKLAKDRHWIMDRLFLLQNENPMEAAKVDHFRARKRFDLSAPLQHGEYLAIIACGECHGLDFKGGEDMGGAAPPDMIVATAYTRSEFSKLMREGTATGGRDLVLMDDVARSRFSVFTDDEISTLYDFLHDRAMTPQ